ncbi:ribonucleotide-diphosphate reductase subunit beta, partial [Staphylococcus agnetis]
LDAQHLRNELSESEKLKADQEMYKLLEELYQNEASYTRELYAPLGLEEDVLNYVRYNGNKALSNLGFEPYFEEREFNPIIENALDTSTKNHDFFSVKGDGYVLALNVEGLKDEDFIFDDK